MKRIITLIVAVVLVLGMTQCRKKALEPSSNSTEMITVTVTAGLGGGNSKTGITLEGKVTWNVNDVIYYGKDASNISSTKVTTVEPNASNVAGKVATFTVTVSPNTKYHFYYCGSNDLTTNTDHIIKFDEQNTPSESTDLQYIANNYHIIYGTATIGSSGVTTIGMNNIMSIGCFSFNSEKDGKNFKQDEDIAMIGLPNAIQLTFSEEIFKVGSMVTHEVNDDPMAQKSRESQSVFEEGATGRVLVKGAGLKTKYVALVPANNSESCGSMNLLFGGMSSMEKRKVTMGNGVVKNKLYTENTMESVGALQKFSVSEAETVYFSPGNLYFSYSDNKWYFEKNSYDCRSYFNGGKYNGDGLLYSPAVIDGVYNVTGTPANGDKSDGDWGLFGWSTNNKYGMNTSTENNEYQGNFVDWGTNEINYNGNGSSTIATTGWFTLSSDQWAFLIGRKATLSGNTYTYNPDGTQYLFAEAIIILDNNIGVDEAGHHINGLVILPDNFILPDNYTFVSNPSKVNETNGRVTLAQGNSYADKSYSIDQWNSMKEAGAIFLPSLGNRLGTTLGDNATINEYTNYWSSTAPNTTGGPSVFTFYNGNIFPMNLSARPMGYAVRLVHR